MKPSLQVVTSKHDLKSNDFPHDILDENSVKNLPNNATNLLIQLDLAKFCYIFPKSRES